MNKQELMDRKEDLEIKLDVYSRSDREAYNRVVKDLFEVELELMDLESDGNK